MILRKDWAQYLIKSNVAKTIVGGEVPPQNPWDLVDYLEQKLNEWQDRDDGEIIDFGYDWPYLDPFEAGPLDFLPEDDDSIIIWPSGLDPIKPPMDGSGNPYYI